MYRSYLLKVGFWAKKNSSQKVFLKHEQSVGGVYAIIDNVRKGVRIIADGDEHFFNNFDKLDLFLNNLKHRQEDFVKIIKRRNISRQLREIEI